MLTRLSTALLISGLSMSALAESHQGAYIGGTIGSTNADISANAFKEDLSSLSSLSVYGGYQFSPLLALEAEITSNEADVATRNVESTLGSFSIAPKFNWQLTKTISLFAKAGVKYSLLDREHKGHLFIQDSTISYDGFGLLIGAGVEFTIADNLLIRTALDYSDSELESSDKVVFKATGSKLAAVDRDVESYRLSLGLSYLF